MASDDSLGRRRRGASIVAGRGGLPHARSIVGSGSHRAALAGGFALACAAVVLLLGPTTSPALAGIPSITRAEIIARADSGIGASYMWGRESWTPNLGGGAGPDCSGYALKCWEVPRTLLYQEEDGENSSIYPRYSSYEFFNCLGPWSALSDRSLLREGDVLVKNNGTSGHVVIYAGGDAWNSPIIYEAPGTGLTVRRVSRYLGSEYQPRRRDSLVTTGIILDNPTAKSTGGDDLGGNWTRSTSTAGFYGDDYQVRAATTSDSWARWTPRLPFVRLLQRLPALDQRFQPGFGSPPARQHGHWTVRSLRQPTSERGHLVLAWPLLLQCRLQHRVGEPQHLRHWGQRLRRGRRDCGNSGGSEVGKERVRFRVSR